MKEFLKLLTLKPYYPLIHKFFRDFLKKKAVIDFKKDPDLFHYIYDCMYESTVKYNEQSIEGFSTITDAVMTLLEYEILHSIPYIIISRYIFF